MFCDKNNKCEDCKFWKEFEFSGPDGQKHKEGDCVFMWTNVFLIDLNKMMTKMIPVEELPKKEEKNV